MLAIVMCLTAWVLGMTLSVTLGGAIHLFLVLAIAGFLMQMVRGRAFQIAY
ncbi:lmo0937 family membrane protein [Gemmatimonas phototrophica]|uniref:lmo0937 family membrane protein n=1 Tax=Gemmatimonas phototrophica TaxID=1379270 RepID=UPI000A52FF00